MQHAVLHELNATCGLAFIVEGVVSAQRMAIHLAQCGVVGYGKKVRQNWLVEQLGKGLPLFVAALALALKTMPKHLMEEHGCSTPGQNCGAVVRLGDGRHAKIVEVLCKCCRLGEHRRLIRQMTGRVCFKRFDAEEVHAIRCACARYNNEARHLVR